MSALVTLEVAKGHLRETTTDADADIQRKVDEASTRVVRYLKAQADPTWTAATVPADVQSAVLTLLTQLMTERGDGPLPDDRAWQRHVDLLRDPTLA
jgi:hypothetical protein